MQKNSHTVNSATKVIVGMSGGVDSSVTALLLQQQGYRVEGLFMKNWEEDDVNGLCTAKEDLADAEAVCRQLDIPLHKANFSAEYWECVFQHFLSEYRAGRTPNPDVLCNREIKFNVFLEYAEALGAQYIATGHYVRARHEHAKGCLLTGIDEEKDQSYFLHQVGEKTLAKCLFPLGNYEKSTVRGIAREQGFVNAEKKDSTGVCFIGERNFKDFLQRFIATEAGDMVTVEGLHIGRHQGLMFYTIGQRQGLGIGGQTGGIDAPWYVVKKDISTNQLILAQGHAHPALFASQLLCQDIFWVNDPPPVLPCKLYAKIRYRQPAQACLLVQQPDQFYKVIFEQPQRAITPGQYLVLYEQDRCLGGGVIERSEGDFFSAAPNERTGRV